jgi:hypothetical protein
MLLGLLASACTAPGSTGVPIATSPVAGTPSANPDSPASASAATSPTIEPSASTSSSASTKPLGSSSPEPVVLSDLLTSAPPFDPSADDILELAGRDGIPGLLDCGTQFAFTFEELDNPTGAEDLLGAEYDALREILRTGEATVLPGLGLHPTAREVARSDRRVAFLIDGEAPGLWDLYVYFDKVGETWKWHGSGGCGPEAFPPPGFYPATFVIDPAHSQPTAATRAVHILVTEQRCTGGRSAAGRIGPAYVVVDEHEFRVQIFVKTLPGGHDCVSNPPTPARLRLPEAIGDRRIRDLNLMYFQGTGG